MNQQKKSKKRLVIDVPDIFHKLIKNRANMLGISIRVYVLRALIEKEERDA